VGRAVAGHGLGHPLRPVVVAAAVVVVVVVPALHLAVAVVGLRMRRACRPSTSSHLFSPVFLVWLHVAVAMCLRWPGRC
jgi:hypothetical protein